ncbi:hypothetical protein ACM711_14255 [Pseudomonas aeruginosa]|nr:hypothetical protein [Pseudomonas aeruginosa]
MKASKPGPKPSGKAKSAAQRMREYRARKAEEALGAEHSDKGSCRDKGKIHSFGM